MALDRLTKITGPGIKTDTNWEGNNANFTGVTTTASSFNVGVTTIHSRLIEAHNIKSTGIITATGAHFSGNVSIAGTLTYEDVTNIDSVGIITAPAVDIDDFLDVGSNIKLGNAGVITATSFVGSGAALTGIDATSIKDSGGNVKVQAQASGAVYTGIHTFNSDLDVDGHTNLDNVSISGVTTFSDSSRIIDNKKLLIGNGSDLQLYHQSSNNHSIIQETGTGNLYIAANDLYLTTAGISESYLIAQRNAGVILNYDNSYRIETTSVGVSIHRDLDVDGHTNLDNVSIAGVTTFASNIFLGDGDKIYLGADNDMYLWHTGSDGLLYNDTGNLFIRGGGGSLTLQSNQIKIRNDANNEDIAKFTANGGVELYYDNVKKAYTNSQGLYITNTGGDAFFRLLAPTGYHATIDMTADTHTNEDNYRIQVNTDQKFRVYGKPGGNYTSFIELDQAGKVTLTRDVDVARHLDVDGHTELDNVRISGIVTATNLTYDGNYLTLNNDADQEGILMTGGDVYHTLTFNANRNIQNYSLGDVRGKWNGVEVNRIRFNTGADTTNRDEGWITFWTRPSGGNITERLRIGSDGKINIAGIVTATTVQQRTSKFYGLTTTDRNALSPSEGDIIYNTTTNKHEFYTATSVWAPISSTPPTFDNASGSLATFYGESRSYVTPTSPTASGDAPITYTIASGSLPSGMSINSSTGVLSGTPNAVGSDTTSNFTVRAANAGGTVERAYSITVKASVTTNYSYTGSTVNWSKPSSDVKRVLFRMWGGAGTHGTCTSSGYPGRGGKTEGVINVESHNTLYLQVGEAGGNTNSGPNGGWPNGGNGNISHSCKGAGGGGSSNIYHSSGTGSYTYIVAVAGGGGSQSHGNPSSNGGDGGGTNGQSSNRGGGGGSQNAGGSQGSTPCGNTGGSGTGTRLQGGTAGTGSGCTNAGAGGGGGWWGGGAGGNSNSGNSYGGGGGGSGYFDTSLVSGGSTKQASESGWDTNRPSGIAGRASFGDNNRGGHGYITLIY